MEICNHLCSHKVGLVAEVVTINHNSNMVVIVDIMDMEVTNNNKILMVRHQTDSIIKMQMLRLNVISFNYKMKLKCLENNYADMN